MNYFNWARIKLGLIVFAAVSLASGFGLAIAILYQVYAGDDSYLKKSTILARINEETSIFFDDEETRLGSFFEQQHRRYVPIEEIPAHMINAIIASEDKYFYDHHGINPIAIFKAFGEGAHLFLTSGQLHFRGGSTITQQTVKNVLDRKEYSIKRKIKEAIAAMQLERLYSKKQILEFYFNQFHVAANGNGIGIAAKYYFNKDVRDLNLVEAAFIAGSVKGPSKYNPFIQYTPEAKQQAILFANDRKNYVIKQMYEQKWISAEEYKEGIATPIPFNKGKFTSREVALVSLIRSQLDRREILDAIGVETVDELSHAGLKVISTLDYDLQNSAQLMMRRNLSRLEVVLQSYKPEAESSYRALRDLEIGEFYYGKVIKISQRDGQPEVHVDFGLPKGVIPAESLTRYAKLMDLAVPQGTQVRMKELMSAIKPGHVVFVEVRDYNRETHQAILEFQRRPLVNGAMVAIEKGEMRAVVSGFDSQGYNRAVFGRRQPGSVFKTVAYFAALQLGWTIVDELDNDRRIYPYQGQFYFPRPDHDSPYSDVSMIWAGTKSENLASIYLTDRLVEKLSFDQFRQLMGHLDLLPTDGENKRDFHYRVARKIGVQLDNDGIREGELNQAVKDAVADLVFAGDSETSRYLLKMWYGRGYAAELKRLYLQRDEDIGDREKQVRIALVKNNLQRHQVLATQLEADWTRMVNIAAQKGAENAYSDAEVRTFISRFRVIPGKGGKPALAYFYNPPEELPQKAGFTPEAPAGRALNSIDVQSIWGGGVSMFASSANIALTDVKIAGGLPLGILRKVQASLEQNFNNVMAIQETYDLPQYFHHHDFRIAVGLTYLKKLCEQMGVFSEIEPVLSFPLGTNAVSVAEVAKIYQTFTEGKIYKFYKEGPANQLNFIKRIEDREGNILFEPAREEHQLVDPRIAEDVQQILRKVVTHGTGSRARGELYLKLNEDPVTKKYTPIRIPSYGKTGTTNDYTTSSFAGFIPKPINKGDLLDPQNSYVMAAYVGYDFNKEMVRGGFKVSGSQGALPVWTDLGKEIIEKKKYIEKLDTLDLKIINRQEWPLATEKSSNPVKVDLARGVILRQDESMENDVFATTDIGVTGEDSVNEFALNASVRSTVRMQVSSGEGGVPIASRVFSLFSPVGDEEDASQKPQTTEIQLEIDKGRPTEVNTSFSSKVETTPKNTTPPPPVNLKREDKQNPPQVETTPAKPSQPSTEDLLKQIESQEAGSGNTPAKNPAVDGAQQPKTKEGYIEGELW